jgi:hypothetical protein
MYASLYNRLCGWLFFTLGLIGLTSGRIGDYLKMTTTESTLYILVGVLGMFSARIRRREAGVACGALGLVLLAAGLIGFIWPESFLGYSEPAEAVLRTVAGCWGIYVVVSDLLNWAHAE